MDLVADLRTVIARADRRLSIVCSGHGGVPHVHVCDDAGFATLQRSSSGVSAGLGVIVVTESECLSYRRLLDALGVFWLPRDEAAQRLCALIQATVQSRRAVLLTRREREVLELIVAGRSYGQIALELRVSVETVRSHARHLRRKYGARDRPSLVRLAEEAGTPELN